MKMFKFEIQRFVETINGTAGHDNISVTASQQFINALGGNDTIYSRYINNVTISGGDGADSIRNYDGDNFSIAGGSGNDKVNSYGNNAVINGNEGDDVIDSDGRGVSISGESGNDNIKSNGFGATIYGGTGADTVSNSGDNAYINVGDGNDSVYISGAANSVEGGSGDDYIYARYNSNNSSLNGGAGEDTIRVYEGNNVSVIGGVGYDYITIDSGVSGVIQYANGDGNDIVRGFNDNDTLQISGSSYSTTSSENNVIVNVGNGKITLVGATGYPLNIQGTYGNDTVKSTPTVQPVTIEPAPTVQPEPTNTDTVKTTPTVKSSYEFYGGVSETISAANSSVKSSYQSYEQINFNTEFRSFELNGDNFRIYSRTGSLTIQNVRGQNMTYGDSNGNVIAYSYVSSKSETIDRRSYSQFNVVIGADNANNQITAGNGGSNLWGGVGGDDTLTGGNGYDEFNYKVGSGNDVIKNAGDNDIVNLNNVSMSQIVSAKVDYAEISATFTDGGSLKIIGNSKVGFLVDGVTYYVSNRSRGIWSTK